MKHDQSIAKTVTLQWSWTKVKQAVQINHKLCPRDLKSFHFWSKQSTLKIQLKTEKDWKSGQICKYAFCKIMQKRVTRPTGLTGLNYLGWSGWPGRPSIQGDQTDRRGGLQCNHYPDQNDQTDRNNQPDFKNLNRWSFGEKIVVYGVLSRIL